MGQINSFEKKVFSQNGEDGVIEEIFSRIGTVNRFFVEFGVEDGMECLTRNLWVHHGWSGVLMEGSPFHYQNLVNNIAPYPEVRVSRQFVTPDNIGHLFQEMAVPVEFDFLSIDIDGNDYWVWQALDAYQPRVVVIEYNASYPPPQNMVIPYQEDFCWDGTSYFGASLCSLTTLGKKLGYALIGTDSRGVNAFFLRKDLLELAHFPELSPESAYHPPNYGPDNGGHPHRSGPILDI